MPDKETLVIANGGIETHPETGRTKLNIATMRSNLSYIALDGAVVAQVELGPDHRRNSIRHLAVAENGEVAFAMQWQGDLTDDLPLLGVHHRNVEHPKFLKDASVRAMQGYLGSIAINSRTNQIAATSPRSGLLQIYGQNGLISTTNLIDVSGVAVNHFGFAMTTGTGLFKTSTAHGISHKVAWDNHLIAI